MATPIHKLPAVERRFLLVASDEKYQEIIKATDWKKVLTDAVLVLVGNPLTPGLLGGPSLAQSAYLAPTWVSASKRLPEEDRKEPTSEDGWLASFMDQIRCRYSKGEIGVPRLSPADADCHFRFDLGHPVNGAAYLLHPCRDDHYLQPATANARLAREHFLAFPQVAGLLGAKTVTLVEVTAGKLKAKAGGNVPVQELAAQFGANVQFGKDGRVERQVFREYEQIDSVLCYPTAFDRWIKMDPDLDAFVNERLDSGLSRSRVTINVSETIDVGADAIAEIASKKIQVGGSYQRVQDSSWLFEVEFWPLRQPA